jgi:hypothetical protein
MLRHSSDCCDNGCGSTHRACFAHDGCGYIGGHAGGRSGRGYGTSIMRHRARVAARNSSVQIRLCRRRHRGEGWLMSRRVIAGRSLALWATDRRRRCTMACARSALGTSFHSVLGLVLGGDACWMGAGVAAPTSAGPYGSMLARLRALRG